MKAIGIYKHFRLYEITDRDLKSGYGGYEKGDIIAFRPDDEDPAMLGYEERCAGSLREMYEFIDTDLERDVVKRKGPTESVDIQQIAEKVDTFLLDKDAFGYGEIFDNAEDFASRETRVSYMVDYLSSQEGRTDTIDHLQQIAVYPEQVEGMVKQIESIYRVQESEKQSKDTACLKEPRKPRDNEREEMER